MQDHEDGYYAGQEVPERNCHDCIHGIKHEHKNIYTMQPCCGKENCAEFVDGTVKVYPQMENKS